MTYLLLKTLHVWVVMFWIGGMLLQALRLSVPQENGLAGRDSALSSALDRWDRRVTSPAMVLTWVTGLSLAVYGGWFASNWLPTKLAIVVVLSALHGLLAGKQRRRRVHPQEPLAIPAAVPPVMMVLVALVIFLVVTKPF